MEQNGLPISIVCSHANIHDSTKFIDVMENICDFLDADTIKEVVAVYADKGYDSHSIRNYLKSRNIVSCIPERNFRTKSKRTNHASYNKTRYVVERFFGWLKNGFHRTRIRYEKNCDNYLGFVYLASIMVYWRVLG